MGNKNCKLYYFPCVVKVNHTLGSSQLIKMSWSSILTIEYFHQKLLTNYFSLAFTLLRLNFFKT